MTESQAVLDLRSAVAAGGRVRVAPGKYILERPLTLTGCTSLIGDYRDLCTIDGSQMTDPTQGVIQLDRMWGYEISNITVTGNRTLNAVGILNTTNTPNTNGNYGTVSGSAIFSHVIIAGFKKGLVVGDGTKYIAASENVYTHLEVVQCDTCIELNDYNTLDHQFNMLQMGDCITGMTTNGAAFIAVNGGSFSSCKGILFRMGGCSASRFRDCRMEESNVFLLCGTTGTVTNHIVDGCQAHQRASLPTEDTSAWGTGWKSPFIVGGSAILTVRNTFISQPDNNWSPILDIHNVPGGAVEATGNTATVDPSVRPFVSVSHSTTERFRIERNAWTDGGQVFKGWYPDQVQ